MSLIETIEAERKNRLKIFKILFGIGGGFVLLTIIFGIVYYLNQDFDGLMIAVFISAIIGIILIALSFGIPGKSYATYCKENLEKAIMNECFKDIKFTYTQKNGISFKEMNFSGVFNQPDEFATSDTVRGSYKDVEFVLSDYVFTVVKVTTDSKGHRQETRYPFPGRYMSFHLERNFGFGISMIEKRNNPEVFRTSLYKEKVEFESIDFNKRFIATTSDQKKAFYLIRPKEIMNIVDLDKKYKGNIVNVLVNNEVYFILADVNIEFSFSIFKKISETTINDIKAYYSIPLSIIETLSLSRDKFNNTDLD